MTNYCCINIGVHLRLVFSDGAGSGALQDSEEAALIWKEGVVPGFDFGRGQSKRQHKCSCDACTCAHCTVL